MCFRTGHCVPGVAIAVRSGDRNVVTSQQNYGMDIPGNVLNERMAAFMHMYTGDDPISMASVTFLFAHFDSAPVATWQCTGAFAHSVALH